MWADPSNFEPDASTHSKTVNDRERHPQDGSVFRRPSSIPQTGETATFDNGGEAIHTALFRPSEPLILPVCDVNIALERRNKAMYGFAVTTSVAHVWFNAFFESQFSSLYPEPSNPDGMPRGIDLLPESGVFSIPWESMDGVRGLNIKGARALDRLSVVWRTVAQPLPYEEKEVVVKQGS